MAEPAGWSKIARRIRVPLGFAFAVLYLWLARPTWTFIGYGAIAIAPGLLIRALASGQVRKNEALATTGPYAYTRNPLYLGSLLIGVGFAIAARSWWIALALIVMFFAIYVPVIRGEEKFLREMTGMAAVNIVHLIYQQKNYEGHAKDYEFSGTSMREHWTAGYNDTKRTLRHPEWLNQPQTADGVVVHDLHRDDDT